MGIIERLLQVRAIGLKMFRYLVLALLLAVATAQHKASCRCGAFITTDTGDRLLYELPAIDVNSCDQHDACKKRCTKEYDTMSGGGDLDFVTEDGETVGQALCTEIGHHIRNEHVYAFYEICNGPWEFTGEQTQQKLCCDDHHKYHAC